MLLLAMAAAAAPPVLLPGGDLVAGEPGLVDLWAPELPTDTTIRARGSGGHAGPVERLADGRIRVAVQPSTAGRFELFLALSGPGGKESGRYAFEVQPPMAGGLSIEAVPAEAQVGGGPVQLLVRPQTPDRRMPSERRLLTQTSAGRLEGPQSADKGWTLRFTPPDRLSEPVFAIIAVADAAAPGATPGWVSIPVATPTTLSFPFEVGASCSLVVGEQRIGPVSSDSAGKLRFSLNLPPGYARGELECEHLGQSLRRTVALPSGKEPTLALMPLPARVPAGASLSLNMVVLEADGTPRMAGTAPTIEASAGQLEASKLVGSGLATARWTAPDSPGIVNVKAQLLGGQAQAQIEVVAATGSPRAVVSALAPAAILGWTDTPLLPAGHRQPVAFHVLVVDEHGLPLPGLTLELSAEQAKVAATLKTDAQGRGRVMLSPQADGVVVLTMAMAGLKSSATFLVGPSGGALSDPPATGTLRDHVLRERARADQKGEATPLPLPLSASPTARTARQAAGFEQEEKERRGLEPAETSGGEGATPSHKPTLAVSAATVPHSYGSTSSGQHGLPSEIKADQGDLLRGRPVGAPAGLVRVSVPLWKSVAWDTRLAARYEGYVVRETAFTRLDLQGASGLRFGMASESQGRPYLLAQAEYSRVPIFTFARFREEDPDKATGARMLVTNVLGARLGAGIEFDLGPLLLRLEGSETLAPWPIHTRGEADLAWRITESLALRTGLELGIRSMRFDLGQDRVRVTDQQHAMSVGMIFGPL